MTVAEIIAAVCHYYGLTTEQLLSHNRRWDWARPRQVAMYLARELTELSYPQIARRFAGRDHSTILNGVERIRGLCLDNDKVASDVAFLMDFLRKDIHKSAAE